MHTNSQSASSKSSQTDQSDLGGKWTLGDAGTFDLYLPVPGNVDATPRSPLLGQCAHLDAATLGC